MHRLAPGTYTARVNASLVFANGTVLARTSASAPLTVLLLPPIIVLAQTGSQLVAPAGRALVADGLWALARARKATGA
jgi:hypothetical protein